MKSGSPLDKSSTSLATGKVGQVSLGPQSRLFLDGSDTIRVFNGPKVLCPPRHRHGVMPSETCNRLSGDELESRFSLFPEVVGAQDIAKIAFEAHVILLMLP